MKKCGQRPWPQAPATAATALTCARQCRPPPISKPCPTPTRRKGSVVRSSRPKQKGALRGTPFLFLVLYSFFMLKDTLEQGQRLIDQALEKLLPSERQRPESIHQAMRHSVFAGGKRLRPILCMEAARMVAGKLPAGIENLGSALEMLHTYSLIHDDVPALDNDELRRGKP